MQREELTFSGKIRKMISFYLRTNSLQSSLPTDTQTINGLAIRIYYKCIHLQRIIV